MFADDIALLSELMTFNHEDDITIVTIKGDKVANVLDFKYLGGWMASSEKDFVCMQ